jgi:hypothetical protein
MNSWEYGDTNKDGEIRNELYAILRSQKKIYIHVYALTVCFHNFCTEPVDGP